MAIHAKPVSQKSSEYPPKSVRKQGAQVLRCFAAVALGLWGPWLRGQSYSAAAGAAGQTQPRLTLPELKCLQGDKTQSFN